MSGGGSSTTTSNTTVPKQFLNAYQNTVNRATQVASTPYQAYTGQLVAGFTPQQQQAQQQISNMQGGYQPMLNNAANAVGASTKPLWSSVQQFSPSAVQQYEDPYQSQVINAAEGQIANTDAQQFNQLAGNAGSAGAFGGDRMGVAQGTLGGQQAIANNSTLAGLDQSNYTQALGEFNNQQQAQLGANEANSWLDSQAGYAYGNLANEGNSLALTDTSALAQSGLTQQQQAQAGLNTGYEQWQAQQAFPYQQTGWLANITEGIGSNVGGSSTTTQTNNWTGGRVPRASGGIVPQHMRAIPHFDFGGSILGDTPDPANSYIPTSGGTGGGGIGRGPPGYAQPAPQQQNPLANPATDIGAAGGAVSLYKNLGLGSMFGGGGGTAPEMAYMSANGVPATWGANAAVPAGYWGSGAAGTDAALASGDLTGASTGAAAAASPGFLGSLGSAVEAGAADVGSGLSAAGSALASGAGWLGTEALAGASAVGSGIADAAAFIASLFNRGGAVEPEHHARGGIVVPFPAHLARGGIAQGNFGEMPYSMAPPVGLMNGTTGGVGTFMPGSANGQSMTAAVVAPGIGGSGGFGAPPYRKGGIVVPFARKHFDDGGATDDPFAGAGATADPNTSEWNASAAPV